MSRPPSPIEAVVFDYGNVLMMVDRLAQCRRLARHSPLPPEEILRRLWGSDLESDAESGRYDSQEQFRRIRQRILARDAWSYEEFLEDFTTGFELNPEGVAALRLAADAGKRTFILSNTSYPHARLMFGHEELTTLPEGYVFSFKVGAMKPDPAIWRYLLSTTGLAAERCVYVDDVPDFCQAAERLGFTPIHYVKGATDLLRRLADLFDRSQQPLPSD